MASRPTTARDLTPEQRAMYKKAFELFDKNNDGKISVKDLEKMMNGLGMNPTKDELKGTVKQIMHAHGYAARLVQLPNLLEPYHELKKSYFSQI